MGKLYVPGDKASFLLISCVVPQLIRDLSRASGLDAVHFNLLRIAAGSIIADLVIHADPTVLVDSELTLKV